MRVVMASSEAAPLVKTGGLADVVGALPGELRRLGVEVSVVLPGFRGCRERAAAKPSGEAVQVPLGNREESAIIERGTLPDGTAVDLVRHDGFFDRNGLYGDSSGDYPDNAARFAFFSRAVLELLAKRGTPDVLHCHDWQSALAVALLRADSQRYPSLQTCRTILTVHNLGYQGFFPAQDWPLLGLDARFYAPGYFEFWGHIDYLKGGLVFADAITTVSRRYAEEICTAEFGHGLEGVLRERRHLLRGILNGVDYSQWSPDSDRHLPANYSPGDLSGKATCKRVVQEEFGLPVRPQTPLLCMITRLAEQKGVDLLVAIGEELGQRDLQLAVLGTGDRRLEDALRALVARRPDRIAARLAFQEDLAHRTQAGSDMLLMPSRYEPCGLNQIYALRYGTVPIVRATGGLDDTVEDFDPALMSGTGFKFGPYEPAALLAAIDRARGWYGRPQQWRQLMANGMKADFSWRRSALEYADLYRSLAA